MGTERTSVIAIARHETRQKCRGAPLRNRSAPLPGRTRNASLHVTALRTITSGMDISALDTGISGPHTTGRHTRQPGTVVCLHCTVRRHEGPRLIASIKTSVARRIVARVAGQQATIVQDMPLPLRRCSPLCIGTVSHIRTATGSQGNKGGSQRHTHAGTAKRQGKENGRIHGVSVEWVNGQHPGAPASRHAAPCRKATHTEKPEQ